MLRHRIARTVLTVSLGITVVGCSSSSDGAGSTTTVGVVASTAAPTSPAPTTTVPAKATGSAATGRDAAAVLVAAWQDDDRAKAATIADAIAIEGMWETPREMINLRSCSTDDSLPEGGCVYRTASGLVQVNTEKRAAGWVVASVIYDPVDDGNIVRGDAPDEPPPTTVAPPTTVIDPG